MHVYTNFFLYRHTVIHLLIFIYYLQENEEIPGEVAKRLMKAAYNARQQAYCPYSDFRVGAAVLCDDNTIVTGGSFKLITYA